MASIFATRGPGQVVRLAGPLQTVVPFAISMDAHRFASAIVTNIEHEQTERVQVDPSFNDTMFFYILGQNPSTLRLSGVSFQLQCNANGETQIAGFDEIDNFYKTYRAGARGLLPVSLGRNAYKGLLVAANNGITTPEMNLGQWSMTLTLTPDRAVRNG